MNGTTGGRKERDNGGDVCILSEDGDVTTNSLIDRAKREEKLARVCVCIMLIVPRSVNGPSICPRKGLNLNGMPDMESYDHTRLSVCSKCGWKEFGMQA